MKNQNHKVLITLLLSAGLLSACNGGSAQAGGGQTLQGAPMQSTQTVKSLFVQNSQLTAKLNVPSNNQWYIGNVTLSITNTGSSDLDLSKTTLGFTSQDIKGKLVNAGKLDNWSVAGHNTAYHVAFTSGNGNAQIGQITADNGNATIKAGETITFTGGFNLNGSEFDIPTAQNSLVVDGTPEPAPTPDPKPTPDPTPTPTPGDNCSGIPSWEAKDYPAGNTHVQYNGVEYKNKWWTGSGEVPGKADVWAFEFKCDGTPPAPVVTVGELDVVVDTTNTDCKGSSACHGLTAHVKDANGNDAGTFVVPDSALGGVYTQAIESLQAGVVYSVTTDSITDTTVAYTPITAKATVVKDSKVSVSAKYSKNAPAAKVGKATVSLANVVPNYTGDLTVQIVNNDASGAVVGTYTLKQGASFTTENLPVSDAGHSYSVRLLNGLADPKAGLFYVESGSAVVAINDGQTTSFAIPMIKSSKTLRKVAVDVSGLEGADVANVSFEDAGHTYVYVNDLAKANGKFTYYTEDQSNFGIHVTASGTNAYTQAKFDFSGVIKDDATVYSAAFIKQIMPASTYDYKVWFKDYTQKFDLSVNGVTTAKTLSFVSSSKLSSSLWGSCFGQSLSGGLDVKTESVTDGYKITLTPVSGALNLTQACTLMYDLNTSQILKARAGGDDGYAHNVIISSMTIDGVNTPINSTCAATGCKDPGNGYVNAGYYAQWAVWDREYNPNSMPFASINDIIYAFIGFDKDTGNLASLDGNADSWSIPVVSKAILQNPYMHAHLSFGGWTNNQVNTAPMFLKLSSSQASMQNFATQAVALMKKTKFSGLDIDWEWWSEPEQAPAKQMLSFYKILRAELDKAGATDGKHYTLTIAVNAGVDRVNAMQDPSNPNSVADYWKQVNTLVDQINLMSYDYHGAYDNSKPAYFHANYDFANIPLDKQADVGQTSGWSIKAVVAAYQANGITAKKLVLGLPAYARTMSVSGGTNGGLLQAVSGAGFGDYEAGVLDYKCLVNPVADKANGCKNVSAGLSDLVFYNSKATGTALSAFNTYGRDAMQPWAYSPSTNTFVTFDDTWSVTAKTKAAKDSGLGGMMFWELDGDSNTPQLSLIKAVKDELNR
ncbi:MAG: chitinase [Pseudomonadota bacterium]|nr:chitinase [Pseudomonadota bacterium]